MDPALSVSGYRVVGVNHRTAPMALRDRLSFDDPIQAEILAALRDGGLDQALLLCTCDRVEIATHTGDGDAAHGMITAVLSKAAGLEPGALAGGLLELEGEAAIRHLFAVAASLDSQVVGEPNVLGQVKAAHRMARDAGLAGSALEAWLQAAYACAKAVRADTAIAEGPVSMAAAAAQVARDLHGPLKATTLLMLGTQEMGELVAEHLLASGVGRAVVTARRRLRADAVAARLGATVGDHDQITALLTDADIIVCAAGGGVMALGEEAMAAALKRRRRRPVLVVDAAVPGNVAPGVQRLDGAFVYDLADLEAVAEQGRAGRGQALGAARAMVDEAVTQFVRGRAERAAVPAITALRGHVDAARKAALAEAGGDAEKATRLLVGRLLDAPTRALRAMAVENPVAEQQAEALLRRLFPPAEDP